MAAVVDQTLKEEVAAGLSSDTWIDEFRERVVRSKLELYELLDQIKREGKRGPLVLVPVIDKRSRTAVSSLSLHFGFRSFGLLSAFGLLVSDLLLTPV